MPKTSVLCAIGRYAKHCPLLLICTCISSFSISAQTPDQTASCMVSQHVLNGKKYNALEQFNRTDPKDIADFVTVQGAEDW